MTRREPRWEWYRTFLAVYNTGSLSAAARTLGLTQPTVGRHVAQLEAALSLKLFVSSFEGFAPTEAAQTLAPYAAEVAATSAALMRVADGHGSGVSGTVRLTASEVVGAEVLPAILAGLQQRHPALRIELILSNTLDDLLRREADIAVRMAKPTQGVLIARRLGAVELGLFAHRRYLQARGQPRSLQALRQHALIGYDRETDYIRRFVQQYPMFARSALSFRADSDLAQLAAIRAGIGIGVCQVALGARHPDLVRVLPGRFAPALDTWLAMHRDLRESARCRASFDALASGLSAYIGQS